MRKIVSALQAFVCVCLLMLFPVTVSAGIGDANYCPPPDAVPFVHNGVTYDYIVQVKGWDLKQYYYYGVYSNQHPILNKEYYEVDPYHLLDFTGTEPFRIATRSASTDCSGTISNWYVPANGSWGGLVIYNGEPYFFSGGTDNIEYIVRSNIPLPVPNHADIPATTFGNGGKSFRYTVNDFRTNSGNGDQCIIYVRAETDIPFAACNGNAENCFAQAKAEGYYTGSTPRLGAVIVFAGATWNDNIGHVGIVTAIDGTEITIRDSNFVSQETIGDHVMDTSNYDILGYIYQAP